MKKTRSDVVISVGANDGRNATPQTSLLDASIDADDANLGGVATMEQQKRSVAFGPDVVDDDEANAAAQPDCCDMMCLTNYVESVLCKADEALCVCSITDNFEAATGIQLCADDDDDDDEDEDDEDDDEKENEEDEEESDALKAVDNSLVKPGSDDSPSNTTCDETVSDGDGASLGNSNSNSNSNSRSNSVLDESSGIALPKDIGVPEEPPAAPPAAAAAAADTLEELIETEKKTEEDVNATRQEEGSILSDTLSAFGGMLCNPFPGDVSPIKKAKAPEAIVGSSTGDDATDDRSDEKEPTAATNTEEMSVENTQAKIDDNDKKDEEPTAATDEAADDDALVVDKVSPADTTDNTANITNDDPEQTTTTTTNDDNNDDDDILDITSDLKELETDATSRRIRYLLEEAYGEHSFSAEELDRKGRVLRERYAGREALLTAALEKKIRERKEAMEAVEDAPKAALGELEGALTEPAAGGSSAAGASASAPAPASAPAASDKSKKAKTRKGKLGKAKSLVKRFNKFSSPKKTATAASC